MTDAVNHVVRASAHNRAEEPDYGLGWAYPLVGSSVSSGIFDAVRPIVWTSVSREALAIRQILLQTLPSRDTT